MASSRQSPCRRPAAWRGAGFTLVELLITIAIAAILVALAAPAMSSFLADQAAVANADEFAEAVRYSRTEAIKRGRQVTLCAAADPDAAPACDGTDWSTGWAINDANGNVLKVQNALRAVESAEGSDTTLTFEANGIVSAGDGDYVFVPVGGDTTRQRAVSVSKTGKVRMCDKGDDECD